MKAMPVKIKNKLRQLQKVNEKASRLEQELEDIFTEYGIDTSVLRGEGSFGVEKTEALTFVSYAEGDVEDNIKEIEEVFLYYVNNR